MSNMYSLLNYISATSKESYDSSWSSFSTSSTVDSADQATVQSLKTGLQAFNDDQQRLIGISTISVVACLTLEFGIDEVLAVYAFTTRTFLTKRSYRSLV